MKTLLHLTSDDEADFGHAIRSARLLIDHADLVHEDVTLLPHRRAIRLVATDSPMADEIADLLDRGVTVKGGETCFDATGREPRGLPGVQLVPSGVSEVVRLQAAGYNYVKIP